jgi:hypothetical protein
MRRHTYKQKNGDTTFCYGELNEGDNIQITLDNGTDGIAGDIDVTDPKSNTWQKICEYLEIRTIQIRISELESV